MSPQPTTKQVIDAFGVVSKLRCSSCGKPNLWEIPFGEDTYFLCSWCDVAIEQRWKRW